MGIKGLHKGLAFCTRKGNIRDYRGKSIAVDSSSWLHRSVYSVSETYVEALERRQIESNCVRVSSNYIISRCRELLNYFHVSKIYLTMDGKRCPLKANESKDREERRRQNLQEAQEFKRLGQRGKADEKYKQCIKIRDDFTMAVMKVVERAFCNDDRVNFVWSPYEADAQLCKLVIDRQAHAVITEDSDVLVYSAAARAPFPVIFKLDRRSGTCDVISMDWLLSSGNQPTKEKNSGSLESLMRNLASREARRPGFGVRLFCQACVLSGCDYALNTLPGIGLVGAFKLVRDNSFRNDSVRFQKILDFLPRKVKKDLDIQAYEATLAKSEAVFYYHVVRHQDGSINPITLPRVSQAENGEAHHYSNHSPFLSRFGENWSFLGDSQTTSPNYLADVANDATSRDKIMQAKPAILFEKLKENPYNKKQPKKESDTTGSMLESSSTNQKDVNNINRFSQFARVTDVENSQPKPTGIMKYLKKPDVRFVKRGFPSNSSSSLLDSRNFTGRDKSSVFSLRGKKTQQEEEAKPHFKNSFDYGEDLLEENPSTKSPHPEGSLRRNCKNLQCNNQAMVSEREVFDLTESQSDVGHSNFPPQSDTTGVAVRHDDLSDLGHSDYSPQSETPAGTSGNTANADYLSDLGHSDYSPQSEASLMDGSPRSVEKSNQKAEPKFSKYFKKDNSRRVTLDSSDLPCKLDISETRDQSFSDQIGTPKSLTKKSIEASIPAVFEGSPNWSPGETIESPLDLEKFRLTSSNYGAKYLVKGTSQQKKRPLGPLEAGFNKQRKLSSQVHNQSARKHNGRVLNKKSAKTKSKEKSVKLDSFFKPRRKSSPAFNQLPVDTYQSHEDFLWNGP